MRMGASCWLLDEKGVSTSLVQTDYTFPTGTVSVVLDEKGSPSYDITQPAAWDFIHPENGMTDRVKEADALVFGSLACRNERTKRTLLSSSTSPKSGARREPARACFTQKTSWKPCFRMPTS
ncbi:MAG: hypothetical protein IPM82_29745 [Saprospiraceae bacterium]|nr:hypothetical protein [Saprospiraceae bacterium]